MVRNKDVLTSRIEQLEWMLDSEFPSYEWAERLERTLGSVERALRRHAKEMESSKGLFAEVDRTRPSLERQVNQLKQQHRDFVDQVGGLREQARRIVAALRERGSVELHCQSMQPAFPIDCTDFLQRLEQFVAVLQNHKKKETNLVLESVDTDIGVGD